jgi:hypothetical protein
VKIYIQELVSAFKNYSSFLYLLLLPRQTTILWHFDYVATKSLLKGLPITPNFTSYSIVIVTLVLIVNLVLELQTSALCSRSST